MVKWEVKRQSSVKVTPLLYLDFLLMCLHKVVSQKSWTPCDVHFKKQTSVYNYIFTKSHKQSERENMYTNKPKKWSHKVM